MFEKMTKNQKALAGFAVSYVAYGAMFLGPVVGLPDAAGKFYGKPTTSALTQSAATWTGLGAVILGVDLLFVATNGSKNTAAWTLVANVCGCFMRLGVFAAQGSKAAGGSLVANEYVQGLTITLVITFASLWCLSDGVGKVKNPVMGCDGLTHGLLLFVAAFYAAYNAMFFFTDFVAKQYVVPKSGLEPAGVAMMAWNMTMWIKNPVMGCDGLTHGLLLFVAAFYAAYNAMFFFTDFVAKQYVVPKSGLEPAGVAMMAWNMTMWFPIMLNMLAVLAAAPAKEMRRFCLVRVGAIAACLYVMHSEAAITVPAELTNGYVGQTVALCALVCAGFGDKIMPQHACRARRGAREGNEAVLPRARRRNRRLPLRHAQRSRHHGPRGAHQRVRRPNRRPVRARVRRVRGQNHAQEGQARAHQGRREEEKVNDVSKSSRDAKRRRIHTKEGSELSSMDSHNIYPAPQRPAREYTHPVFKKLNGNKSD